MSSDRYRLPPSSSSSLWAHLFRNDQEPLNSDSNGPLLPPLAPQDKTATTMRVLLHDTQMNLERFSGNVEHLTEDVKKTGQEIKLTNGLFEKEHDKLIGDIIDLVNRSQTQIQLSLGSPAQSATVEDFFKNVDKRLEGLDQRLDAMQAFNQTHAQALQTQMQAIQTLQHQQNTIMASVAPLLPVLQTMVPQTQPERNTATTKSSREPESEAPSATIAATAPAAGTGTAFPTGHVSSDTRKRQRHDSDTSQDYSSPTKTFFLRKKSRRTSEVETNHNPRPSTTSILQDRLFPSSPEPIRYSTDSEGPTSNPKTTLVGKQPLCTPRRPLQEILPDSPRLSTSTKAAPTIPQTPYASARSPAPSSAFPANTRRASTAQLFSSRLAQTAVKQTVAAQNPFNQNSASSSKRSATLVGPGRPSLPVTSGKQPTNLTMLPPPARPPFSRRPTTFDNRTASIATTIAADPPEGEVGALSSAQKARSMIQPLVFKKKERRSPIKEGKRFIPLVDTDDEDEDD